ncbi:MAG: hypothetical protein KDC38_07455 [Planctomycetes bacterium]|nr:hypothetical protein [Planctomycetota bacterium]
MIRRLCAPGLVSLLALAISSCVWTRDDLGWGTSATAAGSDTEATPARVTPVVRPLPTRRHGHRAHAIGGRLFVLGGNQSGTATRDLLEYDFDTEAWIPRAPMSTPKSFFGSAVVGGAIHAIGGGVIERYDAGDDRWTTVYSGTELPSSHFTAAAVADQIFILGGFPTELGAMRVFDTSTGALRRGISPPDHRPGDHFRFMAALCGELHVVGGYLEEATGGTTAHWSFDGEKWTERCPAPVATAAKFAAWTVVDDRLVIFEQVQGFGIHHAYDPRLDAWTELPAVEMLRALPATVAIDGSLFVIGGFPTESAATVLRYDLERRHWDAIANRPATLRGIGGDES